MMNEVDRMKPTISSSRWQLSTGITYDNDDDDDDDGMQTTTHNLDDKVAASEVGNGARQSRAAPHEAQEQ